MLLILLNTSRVQRFVTDSVTSYFEDKTGGKLIIYGVKLSRLSTINLNNVSLFSPKGEQIASVKSAEASIRLLPLLWGEVKISGVHIDSLVADIGIGSDSIFNLQFIIDGFKSDKTVDIPDLYFPNVVVSRSSIHYTNAVGRRAATHGTFDDTDVWITDFNTELSLSLYSTDIRAAIQYLNCEEQSGLRLDNFSAAMAVTDTTILLHKLSVSMPNTHVQMDSAYAYLPENDTLGLEAMMVNMAITNGTIYLPDLAPFASKLKNMTGKTTFSASITGEVGNLHLTNLHAAYGPTLSVRATLDINGLPDYENAYYYCNIEHINFDKASAQDLIAKIQGRPFVFPRDFSNLGLCQYKGNVSGFLSNLVLYGSLNTGIGVVKTDVSVQSSDHLSKFRINGRISSPHLLLSRIIPHSGLANIGFSSNSTIIIDSPTSYKVDTKLNISHLTYRDYRYQNIKVNGVFRPNLFTGRIFADDPNLSLDFNGLLSSSADYHNCEFTVALDHFRPTQLNLIPDYPDLDISFSTVADFEGIQWATLTGFFSLDSLVIANGPDKQYVLPHLLLEAESGDQSSASIASDLIKGGISGDYGLASVPTSLINLITADMPIASHIPMDKTRRSHNNITFMFDIQPIYPLMSVLDIDKYTTQTTNIYGHLNTDDSTFEATVSIPQFVNGKTKVDSILLDINNSDGIKALAKAQVRQKVGRLDAVVEVQAIDDKVNAGLHWDNNRNPKHTAGEIAASAALSIKPGTDSLVADVDILPTELILQDKRWAMQAGNVWTDVARTIITGFGMTSEDNQYVVANGTISADSTHVLDVALKDISLDYISTLIPEETAITFGGRVSGDASISQVLSHPRITADVRSERFMFNEAYFGAVDASCRFDIPTTSLVFEGNVTADDGTNTARIDGMYSFPLDSLDLKAHANGVDLRFINYYTKPIFGSIAGNAFGDVHVYGITKSKNVAVDVDALAKDAAVTVDFLKSTFYFTDSIHLDKGIFDFGTITLSDKDGNQGTFRGAVYHNYFSDFVIDLGVDVNNMLVLNTAKSDSENFYGTAYGTGGVIIAGDEDALRITCKARTERGTNIVIPIDSYTASENMFITFVDHTLKDTTQAEETVSTASSTNVILDLMIDVDPTATVQLVIDSKSGDMLRANGSGSLRIAYDINADDIKLYGTYQIEQGSYLFNFQNLLRKEFRIHTGSSIAWTGDPLNATIDINAYYPLTADLADVLDESILSNTGRTSVPVQCLLNLSGILTQPNIKFDLHLPNSDEELNRALKNTVNTEEQMNRQIVSLLILGKFMKNDQNSTNTMFSQNELFSVVSSTLSAQLNNWASQMFDNWGFGVNFRTSGEGDTRSNEYEFNFQYSPTNRWEISGNVGYRDDNMSSNPFIGDFDVTYKLIASGKLQAKAYTHTNDYREFKKGLTTQGVGLVFSENFNSIPELIQSWKDNAAKNKKQRIKNREARKQRQEARKAAKAAKKEARQIEKEDVQPSSQQQLKQN